MTDESKLRTITGLSAAWDGEPIKRVRATETVILCGRRVGMHLMVQPEVAATALGDELLTKQGFLSRILACAPESLIGKRMHKASPAGSRAGPAANTKERMLNILETPYPLAPDTRNELEPRTVSFSAEAEQLFWEFADEVEKEMAPGGEYESIRPFAAKLPEHAARLATAIAGYRDLHNRRAQPRRFLLAGFASPPTTRPKQNGFLDPAGPIPDILLAQKLLDWLLRDWDKPTVISARHLHLRAQRHPRSRDHLEPGQDPRRSRLA